MKLHVVALNKRKIFTVARGCLTIFTHYIARSAVLRSSIAVMSYRRMFSRAFVRPRLLQQHSKPVEWRILRHSYSVLEGPSEVVSLPLLARASTLGESSEAMATKKDFVVERKVLAYPPPHYFDTHKVITELQKAGQSFYEFGESSINFHL